MSLVKSNVNINFSQGLDLKTDPFQVSPGRFLSLQNSIFDTGGLLQKRNGYEQLTSLPDTTSTYVTTFNGNMTAIGTTFEAYSQGSATWVNKGAFQPLELDTLPVIRSNTNQSQADTVVAPNNLMCTVYTDNVPNGSGGTNPIYKFAVADSITGQNVVAPTVITPLTGVVTGSPRVFMLGNYFVVVFTNLIGGVYHLQYISINSVIPTLISNNVDISSQYTPATTVNFDGFVINNNLYLAWNGNDGGGAIRMTYIDNHLAQHNMVSFTGHSATLMSVCADNTGNTPVIWVSFYALGSTTGYVLAVNGQLSTVLAPTQIITGITVLNITASAQNQVNSVIYEVAHNYSYDSSIPTHFINKVAVTQAGVVGSTTVVDRSVGLASKSFLLNGTMYFLAIYYSVFQPTYFLLNLAGNVISRIAYQNAGNYYTLGLPSAIATGNDAQIAYFYKDLIQAVNKSMNAPSAAGVYSQTGINLVSFTIGTSNIVSAEIANSLQLTGGFLWSYDGYTPAENNFFVYPDNVEAADGGGGGNIAAGTYFYQVTYEWADNQGNMQRSAPSIPVEVILGAGSRVILLNIPTLRLTYKINNPVKIVIYRWSTAQQTFFQVTSISSPIFNDVTVDSVSYVDSQSDAQIIGNNILYTTGGVVENVGSPGSNVMTLFNNRLFMVDAEDKNLLLYSKQVIEAVPVEMSDLLSIYVAPTTSAQGSTGPTLAASALDDKLILFKQNAIYYITGTGPDNTGANSQYSDAIFITSTVGCANQQSIVFMPKGLMFQSDKGIWLLGRDLSTDYIGAPVEALTQGATVQSAVNVPGTNQVRFTLDTGITLMYDYYYGQWGTFINVPAISSTLYQGMHTYINSLGAVYQEKVGSYLDGGSPVLMSFTTSWLNLSGLQGYERAYFFYLLGTYISPHKLNIQIAYDYNPSPQQSTTLTPDNFTNPWGGEQLWGSGQAWGGPGNIEQWRVFLQNQRCEAFQITINELFDPSFGTIAGQGLTLSGLNILVGAKSNYTRSLKPSRSVG